MVPSVNTNLVFRRRFIHVKRDARALHARIPPNSVNLISNVSSNMPNVAEVAGLALSPPSK